MGLFGGGWELLLWGFLWVGALVILGVGVLVVQGLALWLFRGWSFVTW